MLGAALGKSAIKKSVYEDFEEKDLRGVLEERDRKIRKLEYKIQKLERQKDQFFRSGSGNESDISRMNFIKEKIREEIEKNDRALEIFLESNDRIGKVVELLQTNSQLSDESSDMKMLVEIIGSANLTSSYPFSEWSEDIENIESIQIDLKKRLDELETTASHFRKCFQELQKHFLNLEKKYKDKVREMKENHQNFQGEFNQQRQKRERMKKLLQKAEKQKNDVLNEIAFITKMQRARDLESMDRNELITLTKKLFYRIKDLQKQKNQFLKVVNKNKEVQLEKYKKMLVEVKEVKEKSRLGQSMG